MILALDASTKSSGYAVFDDKKNLITYGVFTASSTDLIKRIQKMVQNIQQILLDYDITNIILEEVRPDNDLQNIKTQKALMYLQAAIAFMVHDNFDNIKIEQVYPNEWRAACGIKTGAGIRRYSLKPADIAFANKQFNLNLTQEQDDIADALGIGFQYTEKQSKEINWE